MYSKLTDSIDSKEEQRLVALIHSERLNSFKCTFLRFLTAFFVDIMLIAVDSKINGKYV